MKYHIRWMIKKDIKEVLEIEKLCFKHGWDEDEFMDNLRQRNCIGMVVEYTDSVIGYMIYELHKQHLNIINFAVHPDMQRQGVGRAMAEKLQSKLSPQRRTFLHMVVNEYCTDALLFFKNMGFIAIDLLRGNFVDGEADGILMEYKIKDNSYV